MPDAARISSLPVPLLLIASIVIVSVLGWLIAPLQSALILNPHRVRQRGAVHRLLTAGWVHGDLSHLAFNMLTLYFFADQVLRALGETRFLVLYVSSVIMGFVPTTLRHMHNPKYNSLGASGAVAALMFSAILLYPKLQLSLMFLPIPVPGVVFAVGYLAYSAWRSSSSGNDVNHDAHFSGALFGSMLTYAFEPERVMRTVHGLW